MLDLSGIEKPILLLDELRARRNLARMAGKARQQGVRFRPHFKTHQSAEIGGWFREEGIRAITVSSVDMAAYFAQSGWNDILIAFTANPRQVGGIDELAGKIHLELLVESAETAAFFEQRLAHEVDVWIKVDVGNHRTGILVEEHTRILDLARQISAGSRLNLRGLLTHAGQTYHTTSPGQILDIYRQVVSAMNAARQALAASGFTQVELSYGDTPACTLVESFHGLDEIRPGNFIFYDLMQYLLQVCLQEDIAVAVACPVVAKHAVPGANGTDHRLVIYGGAVHLSKETIAVGGQDSYGGLADLSPTGWGPLLPGASLYSLSQEHGLARVNAEQFEAVQVGDLLAIVPVHSCLTVNLYSEYLTFDGRWIGIKR
jgi:D-serine deaminase-like pyridoxal phosphate-dependent protein